MTKRLLLATSILLCISQGARAQGVHYDSQAIGPRNLPIANPTVTVCPSSATGTPCTPLSTMYSNGALTKTCSNPMPVVAIGNTSTTCGVDVRGSYGFWAAPGQWLLAITGPGIQTPLSINVTVPCNPTNCSGGSVGTLNGLIFVDGINYTTIQQAITKATALGGAIIDMRGNSSRTALSLGTVDVGNNGVAVTILLGPYNYTATQIVMRSGTKIYGTGRPAGTATGTTITAASNSGNLIVFNTAPATDQPAQGVVLEGVTLSGAAGSNTNNGIVMDASTSTTGLGGVWYSQFRDLAIENFKGHSIWLRGPIAPGANGDNQWITFTNVAAFRPTGAPGNALRIEGTNNFITFKNSVLSSPFGIIDTTGSATNVFIGGPPSGSSNSAPYIIKFEDTAIESAGTAVQIDGGYQIQFDHCHHENVNGVFLITENANGTNVPTVGVLVNNESFNGNVGVNDGNGFIVQINSGVSATNITVRDSVYVTNSVQPDHFLVNNATNSSGVQFYNNSAGGAAGASGAGTTLNPLATPTTTIKGGTQAGNYTTSSTNFVPVDSSNLSLTVTIPVGWKLLVWASGDSQSDTASVQQRLRIRDTSIPATEAAVDVVPPTASPVGWAMNAVITGDGHSHTVRLEFETSNAADTHEVVNTANGFPAMTFALQPSN